VTGVGGGPGQLFAYVANQSSNDISGYTVNTTTGSLTPIAGSPFPAGMSPFAVDVDFAGKFACAANQGSNDVSTYVVDGTTGVLTPAPGSPFPAGMTPFICQIFNF
jgi:6-phosphogluconolactonase (cycloisomerase 2 family)